MKTVCTNSLTKPAGRVKSLANTTDWGKYVEFSAWLVGRLYRDVPVVFKYHILGIDSFCGFFPKIPVAFSVCYPFF